MHFYAERLAIIQCQPTKIVPFVIPLCMEIRLHAGHRDGPRVYPTYSLPGLHQSRSNPRLCACNFPRWSTSVRRLVSYTLSSKTLHKLITCCRITLIAMADLSGLDSAEQGVIATILLASYVVTPFMSVSVSAIIVAIVSILSATFGILSKLMYIPLFSQSPVQIIQVIEGCIHFATQSIQQMSICAVNENPSTVRTCM